MNAVFYLAELLVERQIRAHRAPMVVLSHDAWIPPPGQSDLDIVVQNASIWDQPATIGDNYLADLIKQGFLSTVILLSASNSLERALACRVEPGRYLRLVRGEHDDSYLERALNFDEPKAKLVKFRGDIIGRSAGRLSPRLPLSSGLRGTLKSLIRSSDLVWVGPVCAGADVEAMTRADPDVVWLAAENPLDENIADKFSSPGRVRSIDGPAAAYDSFFQELALATFRLALKPIRSQRIRRINEQAHSRAPADITYSDQLIQQLAHQITMKCEGWRQPALLVYIHDPAAPGGSEVEKRICRYLRSPDGTVPDSIQLTVAGAGIRWVNRQAKPPELTDPKANYQKIVIVDSISFTGRTLQLAAEHLRKEWPSADFYYAVLVAFQDLPRSPSLADLLPGHLISATTTDRHDIFFPWGWTQATSVIVRHLDLHDRTHDVTIKQRPWGTVEVLAHECRCSVRLLSIRAGHRLSYQSHAARDAIFVAVDGEVGFEFDGDSSDVVDAILLTEGEYIAVPRGVRYRFAAYRKAVRLLEIGFGLYDQVSDIERFSDDYGRVGMPGDD